MSDVFSLVEGEVFVSVIENKSFDRCSALNLVIFMFGSLSFEVLLSVMKYAICSSIMGSIILIGMTPLCHGGILSINLTVPIVAFCSQFLV